MDKEIFWKAVTANDGRFDNVFVIGVRTTGIYCKPSCRARLPKRENVDFYEGNTQAEAAGFRACLRCKPREVQVADPRIALVLRACELIDGAEIFSLSALSEQLGTSASAFQRSFKEIVGVSPKKYSTVKRSERFKVELKGGSNVLSAMYGAGYGSSSRLYEKASETLGMTPATYKKGGKGMSINFVIANSDLGKILVARTPRGICSVTFGDDDEMLQTALRDEFPNAEIKWDSDGLGAAVDAILRHLAGNVKHVDLPLDLQATSFQMQVWESLKKIPYGETRSYSEIAAELGDKKKVRAVARACATNRVAVVIPCHRVISSSGKLSGYRWGIERKKKLLANEKERQ